jgi:kinesin family protein 5
LINTSKGNLQVADVKGRGIWIQDVTETYVVSEEEVY